MASRSQSQARSQPATEIKSKATDVASGSKPAKPCGPGGGPNPGSSANGNNGGGKRREPKNGSGRRQSGPPQGGSGGRYNKQPHSRGAAAGNNFGGGQKNSPQVGRYPTVTEADEIEIGSVFKSGSKKQNFNHLLNFKKYEPTRGHHGGAGGGGRGGGGSERRSRGKWSGGKARQTTTVTYTREQYLAANCQFLVKASGDYSVQMVDPDIPVDWDYIEEVKLFTAGSEPQNCPICLFPPRPGKMSRCGHVFCWPCILHYLALSDDTYRKCPICYDKIQKQDLKSVRVLQQENYGTGSTIELRLMKRERNSLFAVPVSHPGLVNVPAVEDPQLDRSLSKLVKATPEQVLQHVLDRERSILEAVYREEKDTPEAVFITEAIRLLEEKVESCALESIALATNPVLNELNEAVAEVTAPAVSDVTAEVPEMTDKVEASVSEVTDKMKCFDPFEDEVATTTNMQLLSPESEPLSPVTDESITSPDSESPMSPETHVSPGDVATRPRHASSGSSVGSEGEMIMEDSTVTADDLDISSCQNMDNQTEKHQLNRPKDVFYFYQESSGQRIFLHALNIQMLVHEFGSLENCPPTLTARILEMDSSTMTEELRNRLRYLRHLPLSCSFDVAELDLNSVVSRGTVVQYKDQLAERRRRRQKKQSLEHRREKKIRLEEMRIMNRFPSPVARIESEVHYPRMDDFANEFVVAPGPSPPEQDQVDAPAGGSGLNFASIAKKAKTPAARQKQSAPAQQQPSYLSVGSGLVRLPGALPRARVAQDSDSETELEGYVPAPPTATLGASLAQALAQAGQSGKQNQGGKKKGRRARGIPVQL